MKEENMKVPELRQKAAKLGIPHSKIRTKAELIKAIKAAESKAGPAVVEKVVTTLTPAPVVTNSPAVAEFRPPVKTIIPFSSKDQYDCILHFADIHLPLETKFGIFKEAITQEKLGGTIKSALSAAGKKRPLIVIVGDLFDHRNRLYPHTLHLFDKFMSILSTFGEILIIAGNHDITESNPDIYDSLTNDSLIDIISMSLSRQKWAGIYYLPESGYYRFNNLLFGVNSLLTLARPGGQFLAPLSPLENGDYTSCIALWHGVIAGGDNIVNDFGISMNSGKKGVPTPQNFNGYDIVLLGDIHKRQLFKVGAAVAAYPGSFIQLNQGETVKSHGFILWSGDRMVNPAAWDIPAAHAYVTVNLSSELPIDLPEYINNIDLRIIGDYLDVTVGAAKVNEEMSKRYKVLSTNTLNVFSGKNENRDGQSATIDIEKSSTNDLSSAADPLIVGFNMVNELSKSSIETSKEFLELLLTVPASDKSTDPLDINCPNISSFNLKCLVFNNIYGFAAAEDYIIDFNFGGKIIGIDGMNAAGKSSIISIIFKALFENDGRDRLSNKYTINNQADLDKKKMLTNISIGLAGAAHKGYVIERSTKSHGKVGLVGETKLFEELEGGKLALLSEGTKTDTDRKISELIGSSETFLLLSVMGNGYGPHGSVFSLNDAAFSSAIMGLFQVDYIKERLLKRLNSHIKKLDTVDKAAALTKIAAGDKSLEKIREELKINRGGVEEELSSIAELLLQDYDEKLTLAKIDSDKLNWEYERAKESYEELIAEEARLSTKIAAEKLDSNACKIISEESGNDMEVINKKISIIKDKIDEISARRINNKSKIDSVYSNDELGPQEKIKYLQRLVNEIASFINNIDTHISSYEPKIQDEINIVNIRKKLEIGLKAAEESNKKSNLVNTARDTFDSMKLAFKRDYSITFAAAQKEYLSSPSSEEKSDGESFEDLKVRKVSLNNRIATLKLKMKNSAAVPPNAAALTYEEILAEKNAVEQKIEKAGPHDPNIARKRLDSLYNELQEAKLEEDNIINLTKELEKQPDYDKDRKVVFKTLIGKIVSAVSSSGNNNRKRDQARVNRATSIINKEIEEAKVYLAAAEEYRLLVMAQRNYEQMLIAAELTQSEKELSEEVMPQLKKWALLDLIERRNNMASLIEEAAISTTAMEDAAGYLQNCTSVLKDIIALLELNVKDAAEIELLTKQIDIYSSIERNANLISTWKACNISLSAAKTQMITINEKMKRAAMSISELTLQKSKHSSYITFIKNVENQITTDEAEFKDISESINRYKVASNILANIPRMIMKHKINTLNKWANEFLEALKFPFEIKFIADETEGKNVIPITYEIRRKSGLILFNNCSGFEKTILTLAGKYALSIAAGIIQENILFIDESLDSADEERSKLFPEIFDRLSRVYKKIIVISHRADIKNLYQQIINVNIDNNQGKRVIEII